MRKALLIACGLLAYAGVGSVAAERGDPAAAEREYRIARRLAAEGSPQAAAALRSVFELDPRGPLADDALLDLVLLEPVAGWPEEIGRLEMVRAPNVRTRLDLVLNGFPSGDRALEARFRRGLVGLEPVPGHDLAAARADLIETATADDTDPWSARARYALAWLLSRAGQDARAGEAFARIVVDAPASAAAARARVWLGRAALRDGRFGDAAWWLEAAIDAELPGEMLAEPLRECAVRRLLGDRAAPDTIRIELGPRALGGIAATPDGGLLLADRREGVVQLFTADERVAEQWVIDEPGPVVIDEIGRRFCATDEVIYRLESGGRFHQVASVGDYGPPAALAAGRGGFWLLDRRGQRIGWVAPGAPLPREIWQGRGSKLLALVWDGARLVALDARSTSLVALSAGGAPRTLGSPGLGRPTALGVDPSGRMAVLDSRAGEVVVLDSGGAEIERFDTAPLGLERPAALAYGLDGALQLFDDASGIWVRRR